MVNLALNLLIIILRPNIQISQTYKNTDLSEFLPFYTEDIESSLIKPRKTKKKRNILDTRQHRRIKKRKKLTKQQMLVNILPFFEEIGITG